MPTARDALFAEAGRHRRRSGQRLLLRPARLARPLAEGGDGSAERHLVNATLANQQYFDGALRYAASAAVGPAGAVRPQHGRRGPRAGGHARPRHARPRPGAGGEDLARLRGDVPRGAWTTTSRPFAGSCPTPRWSSAPTTASRATAGWWYPNAVLREGGPARRGRARARSTSASTRALFLYSTAAGSSSTPRASRAASSPTTSGADVKAAVRAALLSARDPETGTPLVRAVVDTELDGEALGIGGEFAPDLYFDPTPGYQASARFGQKGITGPCVPAALGRTGRFRAAGCTGSSMRWDQASRAGGTWHRPPGRPRPDGCALTRHSAAGAIGRARAADRLGQECPDPPARRSSGLSSPSA